VADYKTMPKISPQGPVSDYCISHVHDYETLIARFNLEQKLKALALTNVKIYGRYNIHYWAKKVEKILGFKEGEVGLSFHGKRRGSAAASIYENVLHFGDYTDLQTIVHEYTHLLAHEETTVSSSAKRRANGDEYWVKRNSSVHNAAFGVYLAAAVENVMEYAEELGIPVITAQHVIDRTINPKVVR